MIKEEIQKTERRPVEELMKTDISVPRNPVLAKLFCVAKFCESAGYGFDRMLVWKEETHKEVLFETSIDRTKVTFMLNDGELDMSDGEVMVEKVPENNEGSARKSPEKCQKTHRKRTENNRRTHCKQ